LDNSVVERKFPFTIPRWDPQPGNVDIWVNGPTGQPELVIETKLKDSNKLYECLWDMTKLSSLHEVESIKATYLVVGFPTTYWQGSAPCADLFQTGSHQLAGSIENHRDLWIAEILGDSTGRPQRVPKEVEVELLTTLPISLWGYDCELRAIRFSPLEEWAEFEDGLPQSGE
jgi:hypothetical protein